MNCGCGWSRTNRPCRPPCSDVPGALPLNYTAVLKIYSSGCLRLPFGCLLLPPPALPGESLPLSRISPWAYRFHATSRLPPGCERFRCLHLVKVVQYTSCLPDLSLALLRFALSFTSWRVEGSFVVNISWMVRDSNPRWCGVPTFSIYCLVHSPRSGAFVLSAQPSKLNSWYLIRFLAKTCELHSGQEVSNSLKFQSNTHYKLN